MGPIMSNVPKLRFKEFSEHWVEYRTDIKIVAGNAYPLSFYASEGALLIQGQNIFPNQLKVDEPTFISVSHLGHRDVWIRKGDILIGLNRPLLGQRLKACQYRKDTDAVLYQRAGKLVFDKDKLVGDFLYQYLFSGVFTRQLLVELVGSDQPYIKSNLFYVTTNKFPSVSEQQKIADFLTAVDTKIEQLTRKEELLKQYKKGVMQKVFSQEIRFKADDGSEFPEWEYLNGNELFQPISNKDHNSDLPVLAITQEHGAIPRDLIDYQISVTEKSVSTYKVVEVGDFIISLRSFQGGIEYSNYKGICSPAYIILRKIRSLNDRFYKAFLKTDHYIKLMNMKIEGIRDGKMISFKQFSEVKLPLPCSEEQGKIANLFLAIDEKLKIASRQLESARTFKKGLLQQMFV